MTAAAPRVVVMGLGLFGGGATVARYFVKRGARVLVTDMRSEETLRAGIAAVGDAKDSIEWVLGEHRQQDFVNADLIVANPAVSPQNALLAAARNAGVRITSEVELFLENCRARIAAVTGTQGKSSTASMATQLLCASGFRAHLCGNVGRSLLEQASQFTPEDICVLEISSYQLESLAPRLRAAQEKGESGAFENVSVVALTNVLADHLERHGTVENYARAKAHLFDLPQRAFAIVPHRGLPEPALVARSGIERVPFSSAPLADTERGPIARALWIEDGEFRFGTGAAAESEALGKTWDLPLRGEFQKENALIALGIARFMGASAAALRQAIPTLHGLPHRMETLADVRGRHVIDNGVSTTPDSTVSAIASVPDGSILLCGGKAKSLPLDELSKVCAERHLRVVAFGSAAESIRLAMQNAGTQVRVHSDFADATGEAMSWSAPGDTILFSPACSSFDAFTNFAARARAFRAALTTEPASHTTDEGCKP